MENVGYRRTESAWAQGGRVGLWRIEPGLTSTLASHVPTSTVMGTIMGLFLSQPVHFYHQSSKHDIAGCDGFGYAGLVKGNIPL